MEKDTNCRSNDSLMTTRKVYAFIPIGTETRSVLFAIYCLYFVLGVLGNASLLAVLQKVQRLERARPQRALRRTLTMTFMCSLAVCGILSSCYAFFILGLQLFVNLLASDWACRAIRFTTYSTQAVVYFNILVITIEKFYAVFHPTKLYPSLFVKKILVGSWVGAIAVCGVLQAGVERVDEDLGPTQYTYTCRHVIDTWTVRAPLIATAVLFYFLPLICITVLLVRTARFLKRRRQQDCSVSQAAKATEFYQFYIVRNVYSVLAYANCLTIPAISFASNTQFRQVLRQIFREK
ncbi:predicted protein [Nematostella vectensis]|uniref:G-protein coupled receptors family 1 profile domain-containing protein n=1 Tax=Nematostella vectensis TaxID=45351 RepID=A7S8K2_NEMVE|nr:predicted protein [Nematostella vectensis]|eukprot:XP_001632066.1 predicted protein [Nematostella vectensis]